MEKTTAVKVAVVLIAGGLIALICVLLSGSDTDEPGITDSQYQTFESCCTDTGISVNQLIRRDRHGQGQGRYNYQQLNYQWSIVKGVLRPYAYFVPNNSTEIQGFLRCTQTHGVRIVPRSGGHSYPKHGFGDSNTIVVDLQNLNEIVIDRVSRTAVIGAGNRLGRVLSSLWNNGQPGNTWILPTGQNAAVGIGGQALGGGMGYFIRQYGMPLDNILEMEMVDADGEIWVTNATSHSDLFWALRGAGGGNFGIVTRFKFKIYVAPKAVAFSTTEFEFDRFPEWFNAFQIFARDAPQSIGGLLFIQREPKKIVVHLTDVIDESRSSDDVSCATLETLLAKFPRPDKSKVELLTYDEFLLRVASMEGFNGLQTVEELGRVTTTQLVQPPMADTWFKTKTYYVDVLLNESAIYKLHVELENFLDDCCVVNIDLYGGAVNELSPTADTSYVHRSRSPEMTYFVQVAYYGPESREKAGMVHAFYDGVTKELFNHKEAYQNDMDEDLPDYLQRYYGRNLDRLVQIKKKYDPGNFFRHPLSIPTKL